MRQLVIFLAVFLTGVLPSTALVIHVDVEPALWPAWLRLAAAHPLPAGVRVENEPGPASNAIDSGKIPDEITLRVGAAPGFKVVERLVLSPVSRMGEAVENVRLDAVQAGAVRVVPLESIELPEIALPVDGLYPDQPGYPLRGEVAAGVRSEDQAIRAWFDSLPSAPQEADSRILWIGAVGDIMPARGVDEALLSEGGIQHVFGDTLPGTGFMPAPCRQPRVRRDIHRRAGHQDVHFPVCAGRAGRVEKGRLLIPGACQQPHV